MEIKPRGNKTFSCSTQLSTKFIMLMNFKMPTIIGILTFISMINTSFDSLKAREVKKRAKIRNRYNQVPHLTQDTSGKVTKLQLDIPNESQEVSPLVFFFLH